MSADLPRYTISYSRRARTDLTQRLPEAVAVAAFQFIESAIAVNPERVGKRLKPPFDGQLSARRGTYRVLYRIIDDKRVEIITVAHRRRAYRR